MTTIHQAAHQDFATENYEYKASVSFDEWGGKDRVQVINWLLNEGYAFDSENGKGRHCAHCGQFLTYAAIVVHTVSNKMIYIGETCLQNRFELATADFQRLRKAGQLNRERMRKDERIAKFYAEHPELFDLDALAEYDSFMESINASLCAKGELTDRQIEVAIKSAPKVRERIVQIKEREVKKAELIAQGVVAPEGKVAVEGEVVSLKLTEDYGYGSTLKMTVKTDAGWCVWVTVPSALNGVERGERVQFTATLTRSDSDSLFAFGKRPSKAKNLSVVEVKYEPLPEGEEYEL